MSRGAEVLVRRAEPSDAGLVAPLFDAYRQFYGRRSNPALALRFLHERLERAESIVFVATDGGTPERGIGFVQLYPSFSSIGARRILVLNDLFVAPPWRAQGVARALLERARAFAEVSGASRLVLSTAADNAGARRLYESLGYRLDPFLHYELDVESGEPVDGR